MNRAIRSEVQRDTGVSRHAAVHGRLTASLASAATRLLGAQPGPADPNRLRLMITLYDRSGEHAESRLAAFVAERHERLVALFGAYAHDSRAGRLLAPDALLVFERLEHDPDRLKELWQECRALDELEEFASVFGVAI